MNRRIQATIPIGFSLALVSLLAGCASQQWIPPSTPHGRLCVEECKMAEQRCNGGQQMAIANCANNVQTELHAYNDPNMTAEIACAEAADSGQGGGICQRNYRQCFTVCGGVVP